MLTWARLSYRQQRWELWLVAAGVALVAVGMLWFMNELAGLRAASPECFPPDGTSASCQPILNRFYEAGGTAQNLLYAAFIAPFGMGVILGAPIVAREIEGGTAQLAWTLGRSRVTWLLRRIAFIAMVVVVLLGVLAVTSELLAAALMPEANLAEDFSFNGQRGWLIVVRGAGALMVGMLVGAVIGRVLPAVLASALVIGLVFTGVSFAMDRWNEGEAITRRPMTAEGDPMAFDTSVLTVAYGIETRDGEFLTYEEFFGRGLDFQMNDEQGRIYTSQDDFEAGRFFGYETQLVIPGSRYGELTAREGFVVAALALVMLGATALVVRRRRPV